MALTARGKLVADGKLSVKPRNDVDWEFRSAMASELVFAWQDAKTDEAKSALERVMFNVAIERNLDGEWEIESRSGGKFVIG